ncbi:hypothetical protein JOB18_020853 [Solea senegalensis]|uniref:Uncharacterized protein n=1 Tax=Solea senegalensis TaxID=28829 RepID=A0AAV6RQZ9_SOLSE|nr:hypothetical protein JOB18_020853 [Solea senegalensis]
MSSKRWTQRVIHVGRHISGVVSHEAAIIRLKPICNRYTRELQMVSVSLYSTDLTAAARPHDPCEAVQMRY